jgi:L-threonine kinase
MSCPAPARLSATSGHASCHGSFGELLQGALPDLGSFLVTLPVELHSHASFVVHESIRELRVQPGSSWKALRLAEKLLLRYGLPVCGELTLESEILRGKGLASSTADLVATYRAVAECYGLPRDIDVLEALLREIEPSDGVMHEGVVVYRHREMRLVERLGAVPDWALVAIDEGGGVDTLEHNNGELRYSVREIDEYAALLERLRRAFGCGDSREIGAVATRSAEINQRVLPKRWLRVMIDVAAAVDALGVVAAHSGTCLAVLIDARCDRGGERVRCAAERLRAAGLQPWTLFSLRSAPCVEPARV